jgi:hypothetical protein
VSSPYRTPDDPAPAARARTELVYPTAESSADWTQRTSRAAQLGMGVGTLLLVTAGHPLVGAAILASAAGLGLWSWRRKSAGTGLRFRIDHGDLEISDLASRVLVARMRLSDLKDVILDTKSIRKVQPGPDAVPAVQFIHSTVGPELDVSRLVLRIEGRRGEIRLTEAFLPHLESVEWAGKIRTFLRSHGWIPEDECEDSGDDDA